jgi:TRAP-type C4-dicarboxylate transport system permease small subunit
MNNQYPIRNEAIEKIIGDITGQTGAGILQLFLRNFINLAIGAAGVVTFFYLIIGGYHYITAAGDKEALQKSVKIITSALLGLAIIFSIFAIIFVIETLFGIPILIFDIPVIK